MEATNSIKAEKEFNNGLASRYFHVWDNYPIQRLTSRIESGFINQFVAAGSKVILLGSGGARELPPLLSSGCDVTAVDISPRMLELGKSRYPGESVSWIEADVQHPPHCIGTGYDAAICLGAVFNYLCEPQAFLSNTHRILGKSGLLLLSVINSAHWSESESVTKLSDGRIRRGYTLEELCSLTRDNGFQIVFQKGIRFFVDLLPESYNRENSCFTAKRLMDDLCKVEDQLVHIMPPAKAKFVFICAERL